MEKNIKQQVKENFQTMEFTAAMEANKELKAEYIRVCGQRSWVSLVNYYEKKASKEAAEPTNETITSEEFGNIEDVFTPTEEPANEETFKFTVSESFNLDAIRQLVDSGQPILNQFCIIHEYFKRESDTETTRYTRMFVKADGEGWKLYDEGSAVAKKNDLKSYRKLGYFDLSNDGYPVGEEYSQITVMRIKKALEKFVFGRSGATQVTSVMTVAI